LLRLARAVPDVVLDQRERRDAGFSSIIRRNTATKNPNVHERARVRDAYRFSFRFVRHRAHFAFFVASSSSPSTNVMALIFGPD